MMNRFYKYVGINPIIVDYEDGNYGNVTTRFDLGLIEVEEKYWGIIERKRMGECESCGGGANRKAFVPATEDELKIWRGT